MIDKNMNRLKEKYGDWALVTGASSGIGEGFAHYLAGAGINTFIVSDERKELLAVKKEISAGYGTEVVDIAGDLSDERFLHKLVRLVSKKSPGIIVNSAGYGLMGYFIQHDIEEYQKMLKVDEEAVVFLTHHFCSDFYDNKRPGAIINISSANADFYRGIPFSALYSSSKSMIRNLSEGVYYEMRPFGIDVLNVSPGPTKTSFQEKANTNTLFFCESPMNVARKSFKCLGKKPSVITNPYTKTILRIYRLLPLPGSVKIGIRAWIYQNVLGKKEHINLNNRGISNSGIGKR